MNFILDPDWDRKRRYDEAYRAMVADVQANCKTPKDDAKFNRKYGKCKNWAGNIRRKVRWAMPE